MNEARTSTSGTTIVLRVVAVLFALGVVVWLAVDAQRKAQQPAASGAPADTTEDPSFLPTSKSGTVDPMLLDTKPTPFLHGSKSMVIEPGSEPPATDGAPAAPATPAAAKDAFLFTSKSIVIQPSEPEPPASKSAPREPRR